MGRSWRLVVALLGVLRAGGAYVPLDPDYPPNRLATYCTQAGVQLALVDNIGVETWPDLHQQLPQKDGIMLQVLCRTDTTRLGGVCRSGMLFVVCLCQLP